MAGEQRLMDGKKPSAPTHVFADPGADVESVGTCRGPVGAELTQEEQREQMLCTLPRSV